MERHRRLNKTLQATAVSALPLIFGHLPAAPEFIR
jgi:hypothetical protein